MSVVRLIQDVPIPELYQVKRAFTDDSIADVAGAVRQALANSNLAAVLPKNGEIAIAVGSRGVAALPEIVTAVVGWFRERGARPFIVPAMGSHGGATDEGQIKVLRELGVTEESAGCPIRSSMETIHLSTLENGLPVYMDTHASKADGIFVINRVKPHTAFTGKHESGILKMLSIGLGKQKGAESCHSMGFKYFDAIMPQMATVIFEKTRVLGGLATVENAFEKPCRVEVVLRDTFIERDAALLEYAKKCMPSLPVRELDVLLINRIGKEISGSGMDPNITGRSASGYKTSEFTATKLGVLRVTPVSKGNATGMGMADAISRRLYEALDFDYTYANVITATVLKSASIPVIMPTDRAVLQCLIKTANAKPGTPRMAYIRDTLTLDHLWVSQPVAEELAGRSDCAVARDPEPVRFDASGDLIAPGWD